MQNKVAIVLGAFLTSLTGFILVLWFAGWFTSHVLEAVLQADIRHSSGIAWIFPECMTFALLVIIFSKKRSQKASRRHNIRTKPIF